jgi:hypothetical protein
MMMQTPQGLIPIEHSPVMSASGVKRKRNTNTLERRVEIIARIERKEITQAEGARLLGVGKAAVSRMMKDKERIKEKMYSGNSKATAKRARSAAHPELEQRVFRFVDAMRKRKLSVPGSLMQSRALKEAEKLGITGFKASQGWLENFKLRFGLKNSGGAGTHSVGGMLPGEAPGLDDVKEDELVDAPSTHSIADIYDRILDIERFANTHNLTELTACTRQMWHILARKTAERRAQVILQTALSTVQAAQPQQMHMGATAAQQQQMMSPETAQQQLVNLSNISGLNLVRNIRQQAQT